MLSAGAQDFTPPVAKRTISEGSTSSGFVSPRYAKEDELKSLFGTNFQPDPELIRAIEAKQCIAFVGAGFTAPITSLTWKSLLIQMLQESADIFSKNELGTRYEELHAMLKPQRPSNEDFALVAQEIQDIVGEERFEEFVRCALIPL